jgi:hypothetical protein
VDLPWLHVGHSNIAFRPQAMGSMLSTISLQPPAAVCPAWSRSTVPVRIAVSQHAGHLPEFRWRRGRRCSPRQLRSL